MGKVVNCANCGIQFTAKRANEANKFCSQKCYYAAGAKNGRPERIVPRIEFKCLTCEKPFGFAPGQLRSYRNQWGKDPVYCSRDCAWAGKRMTAEEFAEKGRTCLNCGKPLPAIYRNGSKYLDLRRKVCDKKCRDELHAKTMLDAHADRIPAPRLARHGYMRMSVRKDPNKKAVEILQHRYVMEQHLGRELMKGETVHHINGDRADNRIENLELFSSRHGPGQRVIDKIAYAIDILSTYADLVTPEQGSALIRKLERV